MRTKSRPPKHDIERNSGILLASSNNNNKKKRVEDSAEEEASSQSKIKQKRMKQFAAMFAVLVAAITTAILLLQQNDNVGDNNNNVGNAVNSTPTVPPTPDNGKNDDQQHPSFIPTTIGNYYDNDDDSPTLTPSNNILLPTLPLTSPQPSQLPTLVPSIAPSTSLPSSLPSPMIMIITDEEEHVLDKFDEEVRTTQNFRILKTVSHDATAFTQGLYYHVDTGMLIEGTGLNGQSLVRIWDPLTGEVENETPVLDSIFFGEGVAWFVDQDLNERFIQLTWQRQQAFIYDSDLNMIGAFNYGGRTTTNEGWGITFDPEEKVFYVSDGSRFIHVWDLDFQLVRKIPVSWKQMDGTTDAVSNLNELEWDPRTKTLLSNVWYKDYIVRIWPGTGKVIKVYDMSTLKSGGGNVLNGIAHHSYRKWWITGKKWKNLYLVEFNE